ncbi:phosphatidylcholine and lysophosphatidylcholine phospholipase [Ascosphaera aggregata]|nr:phosphatidylcholine and lysophosphatidylcholine phospholipase [Ascosphaera aggregata]
MTRETANHTDDDDDGGRGGQDAETSYSESATTTRARTPTAINKTFAISPKVNILARREQNHRSSSYRQLLQSLDSPAAGPTDSISTYRSACIVDTGVDKHAHARDNSCRQGIASYSDRKEQPNIYDEDFGRDSHRRRFAQPISIISWPFLVPAIAITTNLISIAAASATPSTPLPSSSSLSVPLPGTSSTASNLAPLSTSVPGVFITTTSPLTSAPVIMIVSIANAFLWALQAVPSLIYWAITVMSISVPTAVFTLLSTNLTFTMNFTTLLLITLTIAAFLSWFVRYRFLNTYARLPPEPQRKEPVIDLFPDTHGDDSKPGLANYLDEFLSAIKIFGYLERPVFHELTRMMQTKKLIAGETLLLEEEKGFCLVVDGTVQIFVKSLHGREWERSKGKGNTYSKHLAADVGDWAVDLEDEDEDEAYTKDGMGYQMLTEVKNGASMSSLFSILSLFTEDVQLRHEDQSSSADTSPPSPQSPSSKGMYSRPGMGTENTRIREHDSHFTFPTEGQHPFTQLVRLRRNAGNRADTMSPSSTATANDHDDRRDNSDSTPPSLTGVHHSHRRGPTQARHRRIKSIHPDIVARAVVDTTIAIIPESAFRRLTRVYPKATAHIIQVILTRLQRVTFATAHSYLGLTTEVTSIERSMHQYTTFDLPNHLRGAALDRLKEKFKIERDRLGKNSNSSDASKGIALHNSVVSQKSGRRRTKMVPQIVNEAVMYAKLAHSHMSPTSEPEKMTSSPGDLLSSVQTDKIIPLFSVLDSNSTMGTPRLPNSPFAGQPGLDDDIMFRESIVDCMMKAIGLTGQAVAESTALRRAFTSMTDLEAVSGSPVESRRQKAAFNNAFGFIDPYETVFGGTGTDAGDEESVMSMSVMSSGGTSFSNIRESFKDDLEIVYFSQGSVLIEQGERAPGLYYVIDGFLEAGVSTGGGGSGSSDDGRDFASVRSKAREGGQPLNAFGQKVNSPRLASGTSTRVNSSKKDVKRRVLYLVKPGNLEGYVGSVTSSRSFTDVVAKTDVYVGFLPSKSLERIVDRSPSLLLTMAKRLTTVLPRLLLQIDFALEWVQVEAGQVLHHQGDESDAIYIVLNGRLRSVRDKGDGKLAVVGEYGQGDSVGELEVMTESTRPTTLHAIRDTELAKFPRTLFNSLAQEHPGITIQISKLIAQRMRDLLDKPTLESSDLGSPEGASTLNLRTVAILPVTAGVPVVEFGNRLLHAFNQIGVINGVAALRQADILNHLGRHAFSRMGKLKLSQYLADLEEKYGMLLYVADTNVNAPWTQTCIKQADCILLVAVAEGSTNIGEYERFLLGMKTTATKELVLLHVDRYSPPGLTRQWLKNRLWINGGHHHIQMSYRLTPEPAQPMNKRFGKLKQRVKVIKGEIQKYTSRRIPQTPLYTAAIPYKGDFHRLARRLCGKAVGVVLGGGGARGIAHIGVILAMEEEGIPIDIIGGTSIGAFIGALYARDADAVPVYGRAKKFAGRMGSIWRFLLDMTYPSASYTTGYEFNRSIFKSFGNTQIEDFWLEYFCNTTNISQSRCDFHSSGYVWRYVRASMSLAGLVPPLCDEGSMLLDGGYIDNLPVKHMRSLGADVIFAIDVGSIDDNTPQTYGDSLSGVWAFFNRWNPFSYHPNPLTLGEIQARLAYVSSVDALERAKHMPGCFYLRPPVDPFGTLEFGRFEEIYKVGYEAGKKFVEKLKGEGVLPIPEETEEKKKLRRTMAPRRASI